MTTKSGELRLLFILLAAFVLATGCSTEEDPMPKPKSCEVNTSSIEQVAMGCRQPIVYDLVVNKTVAGNVTFVYNGEDLSVTYSTVMGWVLIESDLYVGDCGSVPLNTDCNPDASMFPYNEKHDGSSFSFEYDVPKTAIDECFCVLTQVSLRNIKAGVAEKPDTIWARKRGSNSAQVWSSYTQFCTGDCEPNEDDECIFMEGDFKTFSQDVWGAPPAGGNPASYLYAKFHQIFPEGLTMGCEKVIILTSPQAISNFLPQQTPPRRAYEDYFDPNHNELGELGGNLAALMLTVAFDEKDPYFSGSPDLLMDMKISRGPFEGWTVEAIVEEANEALGGCGSEHSLYELNTAVKSINQNFAEGLADNGFITCP